jgi:hypothetical protein
MNSTFVTVYLFRSKSGKGTNLDIEKIKIKKREQKKNKKKRDILWVVTVSTPYKWRSDSAHGEKSMVLRKT